MGAFFILWLFTGQMFPHWVAYVSLVYDVFPSQIASFSVVLSGGLFPLWGLDLGSGPRRYFCSHDKIGLLFSCTLVSFPFTLRP